MTDYHPDLDDRADTDALDYSDPDNYGAENAVYLVEGPLPEEPESAAALQQELRATLSRGLAVEPKDVVLFALHIGCGAVALELQGAVEPTCGECDGCLFQGSCLAQRARRVA